MKETLEKKLAEHRGQLDAARGKLAEAEGSAAALRQLVLRIEGAVLAVAALLEKKDPPAELAAPSARPPSRSERRRLAKQAAA